MAGVFFCHILLSGGCQWVSLMISLHWFRWWLGAISKQAITIHYLQVNIDPVLYHHMGSLGHNELSTSHDQNNMCWWYGSLHNLHYSDVIIGAMVSQITSLMIVYSTIHSGADQRKHQSSASRAFVRGIHWWPVNSLHKWPVTQKMFSFDDVIMTWKNIHHQGSMSLALYETKSQESYVSIKIPVAVGTGQSACDTLIMPTGKAGTW